MESTHFETPFSRLQAFLGLALIATAGVLMGLVELQHIQKMSSSIGLAVFAILPFGFNIGLVLAAGYLWRSRFEGREILRIAGWVVLGMVVIGLLAVWTITHQNVRGKPFSHAKFVVVNNLGAGGLIGFVVGWYDALRRRHRQQTETERGRLEFLNSTLRHNVLNGMNVILGNLQLLEDGDDEAADRHIETIRNRSQDLARYAEATNALMANFLGHTDTTTRLVELSAFLTEEVETARMEFDEAEFTTDLENDLYVEGDDLMAELFANLLSNAVLHNDKQMPRVRVTARATGDSVVVSVADNGPGIPDGVREEVLGWNVKGADSDGTGLGLAIAKTVAERYGGSLWIEDNDPVGTEVNVDLPLADSTPSSDGEAEPGTS